MAKRIFRTKTTNVSEQGEIVTETEEEQLSILGRLATASGILIGLGALATAAGTLWNYNYQWARDIEVRTHEVKKPFYEQQFKYYFQAVETVGRLATSSVAKDEDIRAFWVLYYSLLAAVEDVNVDRAMVIFGHLLNSNAPQHCLKDASLLLSHCVKKSLEDTWQVNLGEPPELSCNEESRLKVSNCR
jgi:hypothetical protein